MKNKQKIVIAGTLAALTVVSTAPAAFAEEPAAVTPPIAVTAPHTEGENSVAPFALTIQSQIDAALAGKPTTITLTGEITEDLTIPDGKIITLKLEGCRLTNVTDHTISNSGTLTIEGSGVIDSVLHGKAALYNQRGGTVILNGGTYLRSQENGSNKDTSGGNSYYNLVNLGKMTINDGVEVRQTGNYSSMVENGFYNGTNETVSPKLTINGGTFSGGLNTVKNDDRGVLEIIGGSFSNVSQAVILNWNQTTIEGGTFQANTGAEAVIYNGYINDTMDRGTLTIEGGHFIGVDDVAVIREMTGGAASIGSVTINDGTFETGSGQLIQLESANENKAKISIVKGQFTTSNTESKKKLANYVDPSSKYDAVAGTVAALTKKEAAASIDGKYYASLADAITAAQAGDTIKLESEVQAAAYTEIRKVLIIDFNGHTMTSAGGGFDVYADLTLKGGTLDAAIWCVWVQNGATVNIEKDMTLNADLNTEKTDKPAVVVEGSDSASPSVVNIEGTVTARNNFAVSGNGTEGKGNVIINIKDGANISTNESAVYMPNTWKLNISGGTITGATGIYIKSGTTNITGGTIIATGEEAAYEYKSGGANSTGQAVVIDKCAYPGGTPNVTISGGTFIAEKASSAIGSYTGGNDAGTPAVEKFVAAGNFSSSLKNTSFLSDSLNAELKATGSNSPYSYYDTVDEAKAKAEELGGGLVTDLRQAGAASFTITLNYDNGGETATETISAEENSTLILPTPTRSGSYTFLHWTDGANTYAAGSEYTVTAEATLTAVWQYTGTVVTGYAITVPSDLANGSISVSPRRASKGTTVTITVTPDEGYVLASLTVRDGNGNEIAITKTAENKYTFKMPAGRVSIGAAFNLADIEFIDFVDVLPGAFYYDAVRWAVENGITTGTTDTTFSPELGVSRAEAVTFLWRAAGSPEPQSTEHPFTDLDSSAYYYKAVLWAVETGVTKGTSADTFSPEQTVNRAQLVTFLARAGKGESTGSSSFTDVKDSDYFAQPVAWAEQNGVTKGVGGGKFGPDADCTRAQLVTMLYRLNVK